MLDTNVLFSAMYGFEGNPYNAFSKASELPYRLVLCDQIVDELRRNFNRKFPMKIPALERFLSIAHYDLVTLTPEDEAVDDEKNIRDLDDRPILRAARKAGLIDTHGNKAADEYTKWQKSSDTKTFMLLDPENLRDIVNETVEQVKAMFEK